MRCFYSLFASETSWSVPHKWKSPKPLRNKSFKIDKSVTTVILYLIKISSKHRFILVTFDQTLPKPLQTSVHATGQSKIG